MKLTEKQLEDSNDIFWFVPKTTPTHIKNEELRELPTIHLITKQDLLKELFQTDPAIDFMWHGYYADKFTR